MPTVPSAPGFLTFRQFEIRSSNFTRIASESAWCQIIETQERGFTAEQTLSEVECVLHSVSKYGDLQKNHVLS